MSYLQVKNHALLNYTKMELYFTLLKVRLLHTGACEYAIVLAVIVLCVLTPSLRLYYFQLEAPESVHDHPIFKELVRYRTLLERIRCVALHSNLFR